jgi:hypothetical protein
MQVYTWEELFEISNLTWDIEKECRFSSIALHERSRGTTSASCPSLLTADLDEYS